MIIDAIETISIMFYISLFLLFLGILYTGAFFYFTRQVKKHENYLIGLYIEKIGKIPAIIETIRPYVADERVFDSLIRLHRDAIIATNTSIYDILGSNLLVQREFEFLMKLSARIPEIQKKEYFLYMRDFFLKYERHMKKYFGSVNDAIDRYNHFIDIKNLTII